LLMMKAGEADVARRRKGRATSLACGESRIHPCALHDEIQLAELAPDPILSDVSGDWTKLA